MNLQLIHVISNWEQSGQGDGGLIDGGDDFMEEDEDKGEEVEDGQDFNGEDNVAKAFGSTKNHP